MRIKLMMLTTTWWPTPALFCRVTLYSRGKKTGAEEKKIKKVFYFLSIFSPLSLMSSTSTFTIVLVLRPPCNNDYYWLFIFALCNIFMNILIVLRPPCKQQTISFESWNLNSARPKNSDWSWFGEKLARSNFPLIHPSITFCYKTRRRLRLRLPTCESREEGVCGVRGGPGILFPYALGLDQDLTLYLIQNYFKLLQTVTKYALGQNQNPLWWDLQVSTA